MFDLSLVENYLGDIKKNRTIETNNEISILLKEIKNQAVNANDQDAAKKTWCYEQILSAQTSYILAFNLMKEGDFYSAWCQLERVEIDLHFLWPHFSISGDEQFSLVFIEKHTKQFQSLFPYKYFISPGMLHLKKECSICDATVSLRNPCGHKKGEIYDGEMCIHKIIEAKSLEFSIVTNPVQKYSVLFLSKDEAGKDIDDYDYSAVKYVIDGLRSPFDGWDIVETKTRHPHELFNYLNKNDKCPCDSGRKYKNCCLKIKEGVLRPHKIIYFHVPPPEDLPAILYTKPKPR